VSFGPGWRHLSQAQSHKVFGIDLNMRMGQTVWARVPESGRAAHQTWAKGEGLPFPPDSFDCVLNSLAFSGHPDAGAALDVLMRVLRPGGRLVFLDLVRSDQLGLVGRGYVALWSAFGAVIRRMDHVSQNSGLRFRSRMIGAGGSLQRLLVDKSLREPGF